MEFCWVTINVKDMEKSLQFYQEIIGLTVKQHKPIPGSASDWLARAKGVLALAM